MLQFVWTYLFIILNQLQKKWYQHLCDLSKEKLIVSFAPYTPVLAVLKNIGKLFPGPSKTTRAYTLKEQGIINAAQERGFKVVRKKLNQAPFYFSKLIEFEKIQPILLNDFQVRNELIRFGQMYLF